MTWLMKRLSEIVNFPFLMSTAQKLFTAASRTEIIQVQPKELYLSNKLSHYTYARN